MYDLTGEVFGIKCERCKKAWGGAKYVARRTAHVGRFAVNLAPSAIGYAAARGTGRKCSWGAGLQVICNGGPRLRGGFGGITIGNVFINNGDNRDGPYLRHEGHHSTQWALMGPAYLPAYIAASAGSAIISLFTGPSTDRTACHNPFEQSAGLSEGRYDC